MIRTTIWSDRTTVPPVTAERSPPDFPDHRRGLAGDGGLVDGCDALDDVAVAGIRSPASTTTTSPSFSAVLATCSMLPSGRRRRGQVSCCSGADVAACAATLGHGLGERSNSTVSHSQIVTPMPWCSD